jgi:hypothetical protein
MDAFTVITSLAGLAGLCSFAVALYQVRQQNPKVAGVFFGLFAVSAITFFYFQKNWPRPETSGSEAKQVSSRAAPEHERTRTQQPSEPPPPATGQSSVPGGVIEKNPTATSPSEPEHPPTLESKDLPPRKPQVIVVAGDDSNSDWTANITLEELERALVQSDRFATILHSELPHALKEQLARSSVNDLAQICQTAATLNIHYVVVGKCLSIREEKVGVQLDNFAPSELSTVVRIQMVNSQTKDVLHSKGFNGREGPMLQLDARTAYRRMMSRFAIEFVSQLRP